VDYGSKLAKLKEKEEDKKLIEDRGRKRFELNPKGQKMKMIPDITNELCGKRVVEWSSSIYYEVTSW